MSENNNEKSSGWWKWLKWMLIPLVPLLLLCIALMVYRLILTYQVESIKHDIQAAGYPLSRDELDKWHTYPKGKNAADIYVQAFDKATTYEYEEANKKGLPLLGTLHLPPRGEPLPEKMRKIIAEYLADNKETLRLLHDAGKIKDCRFPYNLEHDYILFKRYWEAQQCVYLLSLAAAYEADNNNPEKACKYLLDALVLAKCFSGDPNDWGAITSKNAHKIIVSVLEKAINRIEMEPEQLLVLQNHILKNLKYDGLQKAMIGQRAIDTELFVQSELGMYRDRIYIRSLGNRRLQFKIFSEFYCLTGMMKKDELSFLRYYEKIIPAANKTYAEFSHDLDDAYAAVSRFSLISYSALNAHEIVLFGAYRARAIKATAATALAVERFRIEKEHLPESLDKLVPEYIKAIPLDPFDGGRLRYKRIDKRNFVVYSVNDDLKDDGGVEYTEPVHEERWFWGSMDETKTCDVTFTIGPSPELAEWQKTMAGDDAAASEQESSEEASDKPVE